MRNKTSTPKHSSRIALLVMFCLLMSPMTAWARKGEKNFKRGLEFEKLERWDQAAQEFALAAAELPSDTEYQLHYRRALFNASQKYMREGAALAEKGDYKGAYNAFRLAYGYDPVNQLAVAEMERAMRLQGEKEGIENGNLTGNPSAKPPPTLSPSSRAEQLQQINYSNNDLKVFIKKLGDELGINIVFDYQFQTRNFSINLRDVTTAQALDYIFATQNLFFQRLGPRTIIVADQSKRPQFQQLVVRTFYIINVDAEDARTALQAAFPPTAGRQVQIFVNKKNNSLIIRDTPENIVLIEQLLKTFDKDRAEVVMDVEIFEVNRSDFLQLGNQLDPNALLNLGGYGFGTPGTALSIGNGRRNLGNTIFPSAPATGATFIIPPTTLSLLQGKGRTRLLNRTQVHAFEGEATNINIGAKVPVQTASVVGVGTINNTTPGTSQGAFSNGFPVIQYQDTGLTLKFTPTVFPNQDVQVKLEITSSVPQATSGSAALTPTFNQRTLNGTARIPNNRTLMIASVTQDTKSTSVQGLPILGLIPIFGRLFATPNDTSSQTDVVIIVTPRVLRAPNITPEDARTFPTGTVTYSTSDSVESLISQMDRDDQAKGLNGRTAKGANGQSDSKNDALASDASKNITLPATSPIIASASPIVPVGDEEPPAYIPAPKMLAGAKNNDAKAIQNNPNANAVETVAKKDASKEMMATNANLTSTSNVNGATNPAAGNSTTADNSTSSGNTNSLLSNMAEMSFVAPRQTMRVGEKQRVLLALATNAPLGMIAGVLRFDAKLFAVRAVNAGTLFGTSKSAIANGTANTNTTANITQLNSAAGSLLLMMSPMAGALNGAGTLVEIEIEALAKGESEITFDRDSVRLIGANGQGVGLAQFATTKIKVE